MNTIIAIGAAHALYLALLVVTKKEKALPDFLLTLSLLLLAIVFGLVFFSYELDLPFLQIFLWNFSLLLAPAFFLYTASLMSERHRFRLSWLWHFVPYIISFFYLFYLIVKLPESAIDELFANQNLFSGPILFNLFSLLELLVIPFYVIWIFALLRNHRNKIIGTFSRLEGRELNWLKILAIGILGLWLVINGIVFLNSGAGILTEDNSIQLGFASGVFFIFYMGYFGLKQTAVFNTYSIMPDDSKPLYSEKQTPSILPSKKYEKSGLKKNEAEDLSKNLLQYMEQEKPFLQNDLTIHDLANRLNISHHYLSQILNENLQKTFFDFINQYRVEAFKKQILEGENKKFTLLAIALNCGFNSKSSFNRIFKKITGVTPGTFVKSLVK